eukprot:c16904_g1_i1.p1 GENE.c16904_g1_i1~~c16904_g1_i1.p1  ORF type:complete len:103 (-),score=22.34 c16904_g1_i1:5-313(-)
MAALQAGDRVWIEASSISDRFQTNSNEPWVHANVVDAGAVTLVQLSDEQIVPLKAEQVFPASDPPQEEMFDLSLLSFPNTPEIVNNLRAHYEKGHNLAFVGE